MSVPCQVKKCLSNVGGGGGFGGEGGEEDYEIERRHSSCPYMLMSPEVRITYCIDDALQIFVISVSFPRNVLHV